MQNDELVIDWNGLVAKIHVGEQEGMEQLYLVFNAGVRSLLQRRMGTQDAIDKMHDVFLIVVQAIQKGDLREPERLMGFVRTVARRQCAMHIGQAITGRKHESGKEILCDSQATPELAAISSQRTQLVREVLSELSAKDREVLTRFYVHEQTQEQICKEMRLTSTQYRLLKSRAKAKFGHLGRRRITSGKNILARVVNRMVH